MDGRYVEPRKVMWAVAEVTWRDASGTSFRAPATLEDTSTLGACLRVRQPFVVGAQVTIKWPREQFAAVAKNCRSDGRDFLLGVRRDTNRAEGNFSSVNTDAATSNPVPTPLKNEGAAAPPIPKLLPRPVPLRIPLPAIAAPERRKVVNARNYARLQSDESGARHPGQDSQSSLASLPKNGGTPSRPERNVMQPKTLFPHFWRRPQDGDAAPKHMPMEDPVNKSVTQANTSIGPRGDLLSYQDIYRAAGILSPGSGYGIHKVVEMLNSDRIRDLSNDVKRASVLMALDAAGISIDELLTDATRRQNALNSYEASQRKQLEDFETRKAQENSRIEEEMEKIRGHYAQRMQTNLDQVTKEKDALRNWQNAMQSESQRIADVLELCGKQEPAKAGSALAAAASTSGSTENKLSGTTDPLRPGLIGKS